MLICHQAEEEIGGEMLGKPSWKPGINHPGIRNKGMEGILLFWKVKLVRKDFKLKSSNDLGERGRLQNKNAKKAKEVLNGMVYMMVMAEKKTQNAKCLNERSGKNWETKGKMYACQMERKKCVAE